ncbi:MAG: IS110 family transposase [Desulfobulbus sp.]|nr:IS110 family transposase [Desulfobulbus sp.]
MAKEASIISKVTRKDGKGKRNQINFEGKSCLIGVDVHKASYAVAILDEEGQRLEFSTVARPRKLVTQLLQMGMTIKALTCESGPCGYGLA